ncbi:MAG: SLC13 family permease [Rhodospirillales bacterium]|nr:SLC13 family permease [Rhodospirillales bacterium]
MWATFALVVIALALYASEKMPMEVISIGVVCALLVFFQLFPVLDPAGRNVLDAHRLLQGFANPALVTVLALLVMGQGMVRAGLLDVLARIVLRAGRGRLWFSIFLVLMVAISISAFLNNIPVVVIFIPIMQGLAMQFSMPPSKLMIPLSYAAVLGGMTTLVGSSTNLLVNSAMIELDLRPFGFFDFTVPGIAMVAVGLLYLMLVAPRILPGRASMVDRILAGGSGKQFIAQLTIAEDSTLVGMSAPGGLFPSLPDITVRLVQRDEEAILPPFEGFTAQPGDVLVVAATRKALTDALSRKVAQIDPKYAKRERPTRAGAKSRNGGDDLPWDGAAQVMAEVMVAPGSRYEGQTLRQIGFFSQTHCVVLGIQRRSRMIRTRMTEIRLEAGDVLLVQGDAHDINQLKANREVVLIEWSAEELQTQVSAPVAALIFAVAIGIAATGLVSLVVATLTGAVAMVVCGALNVRQAARAVDPKIVTTIGAALAMGVALQETGGAQHVARLLVDAMRGAGPSVVLSVFFLTVAVLSNLVTTKTAAVLFTPIAIDIAREVGVPAEPFAVAVVFAANCSFASPLGYQTNLLVLGPGHYRFIDFARAGIPLIVLLWLVFSAVVPWWYGL